eukprot:337626_1
MSFSNCNNYFLCPQQLNDENDYLKLIQCIYDYTKRCYSFKHITEKNTPFPLLFILNLYKGITQSFKRLPLEPKQQTKCSYYISDYAEQHFLQHYRPEEIPEFYAKILSKKSISMQKSAYQRGDVKRLQSQCFKYQQLALDHIIIHENHRKNNNLSILSINSSKLLYTVNCSSSYGSILSYLIAVCNDQQRHSAAVSFMDKAFQHFILKHNEYSNFNGQDCTGAAFIVEAIKRLSIAWDPNCNQRYQRRYKYLLKIALKTWKKYYYDQRYTKEKYGLMHIYIGYYYGVFTKNKYKSLKWTYKGVNILKENSVYTFTLRDVYDFLFFVERA